MQSHIVDIRNDDALVNIENNSLELDYSLNLCRVLCKTQEGWKIEPGTRGEQLYHGALENPNRLYEIHGHMVGDSCLETCRRHTVDGKQYPGELHLVHFDPLLSFSPDKFNKHVPDRRAIVCILLEEGKVNNELLKFTSRLPELSYKVPKLSFDDDVQLTYLFPEKLDFWLYKENTVGATYVDNTTWIIFKNPVEASREQINAMRSPYGRPNGPVRTIPPQSKRAITEGQAVNKGLSVNVQWNCVQ